MSIKKITIESESKGPVVRGKVYINTYSDIYVELENEIPEKVLHHRLNQIRNIKIIQ